MAPPDKKPPLIFKRRTAHLRTLPYAASRTELPSLPKKIQRAAPEYSVLVLNAGREMANEITMQLTLQIPGCNIMYAPTLALGQCLLKRREMDLVVSSPLLPDGTVGDLQALLKLHRNPPDLVIVGDRDLSGISIFEDSKYHFVSVRRMCRVVETSHSLKHPPTPVAKLGADLRNDLNNPLQEIVALVFVARASGETSPATSSALNAIERAATSMSKVVWDIEGKIESAVRPSAEKK